MKHHGMIALAIAILGGAIVFAGVNAQCVDCTWEQECEPNGTMGDYCTLFPDPEDPEKLWCNFHWDPESECGPSDNDIDHTLLTAAATYSGGGDSWNDPVSGALRVTCRGLLAERAREGSHAETPRRIVI
jgi:hypothetical protein